MKRFLSLWMFLLCFIGGAFADEVMINFPEKWSGTTDMTTLAASDLKWGDISLAFADGGGTTPKYYNNGAAIRMYNKNTLTITAPAAKPITKMEFLFGGDSYAAEAGNFSAGSLSGTIWTGSASTIVITNNKASGQIRICSIKITFGAGGDDPAPGPQLAEGAIIDFPTAKTGITIKSSTDGQVKYNTVKIHNNTDAVDCIQFGKSFKYTDTEYYYALLETEGGFKKGDVISIAGVYNNADTKNAAIAFYADPAGDAIWTTENFINSRSSADDPVAQTFTLKENAEKLYIGRKGNTGTCITDLKVLRGFITISPAPGDIYAAYNAAVDGIADIKKVTINLEKGGDYTISQSLVASASIVINGNGATIDASALEAAMITTPAGDLAEWQEGDFIIKDANFKGVKKGFFTSARKNFLYKEFTIDNCVIEIASTNGFEFDFRKGSVAKNFNILNSTIYAPEATKNSLYTSQSAQKGTEAPGVTVQTFTIENSTLYNLAKAKNFFTHRQSNQKWLAFTLKNNIFVNCGKTGQVVKGVNGGSSGANPIWTIDGNVFNFDGADTSAAESTGDVDEPVKNSIAGLVIFTDAVKGDFNGTFAYDDETAPEKAPGDPRWTLALKEHYQTIWSSEEPVAVTWGAGAFTIAAEKFANAEIGDNLIVKIVDPQVYTNPWDAQVALKSPRDGWPELEDFTNIGTTTPAMVTYVLTGDILAEAKKNGLVIAGNNFKTDRVSIEATSTTGSENSIWIGEQTDHLVVSNYHFANANNFRGVKVNDIIRVTIKEPKWLGIAYNKGWNWTGFADGDIETKNDWTNPVVDFVIKTEAAAKEMNDKANNNGVIFNTGAGAVPLQVELIPYFDVATLNKLEDEEEFTYTNEVVVAAIAEKGNNRYVYIKDDSGYSLIYDKGGNNTKALEVGKTIKAGWKGQVSYYNGLFEVVPAEALAATDAPDQEIEYAEAKTLKVFNANNVNKIYKVKDITLSDVNNADFKVKRGTLEVVGRNQFDGIMIGEGLVCDEVIAAVGYYDGTVQLQPIKITVKPFEPVAVNVNGGDITEAIATAREGKNPSTLTINLAKADYTVSAPIVAYGDVTINGNGAKIDASELGDAFIKISAYPATTANANGVYEFDGINIDNVEVKNLKYQLIAANNAVKYLYKQVKVNKSIIAIDGTKKKSIFDFTGVGGTRSGNAEELIVSNSTMYAFPALEQAGGLYSNQSGSGVIQDLKGTKQVLTIENSTLYNISKGKNTCSQARNNQAGMAFNVKNSLIVNCGKNGQFLKGLDGGSWKDKPTWTVENSSFAFTDAETGKDKDVAENELKEAPENVVANGVVYSVPFFRKNIEEGDFTLGVCAQIGKNVGDPRWYNIPMITKLQNALHRAAALLDGAQADWMTAPAADEAIEKLAGAYNENAPYLNSYYQEEVDEATLRMEAAIAEFEMVYGSDVTAIKSVDALKADGTWYTINGQRISKPTEKGIYIHNGRKVVVK